MSHFSLTTGNSRKPPPGFDDVQIDLTEQPAEQDWQQLEENIDQFNFQVTGYRDYRPLAIFVRSPDGTILAGLTGFTWGGTLHVLVLWVGQDMRKQGFGARLLALAEREAIARGCQQAVLETHSFQAPAFYPARGYILCGVVDNFPVGHQHLFFQKRLIE